MRLGQRAVGSSDAFGIAMVDDVTVGETRAEQRFAVLFHGDDAIERTIAALAVEIRSQQVAVGRVESTAVVFTRRTDTAVRIVLFHEGQNDRQPFHVTTPNEFARGRRDDIGAVAIIDVDEHR